MIDIRNIHIVFDKEIIKNNSFRACQGAITGIKGVAVAQKVHY